MVAASKSLASDLALPPPSYRSASVRARQYPFMKPKAVVLSTAEDQANETGRTRTVVVIPVGFFGIRGARLRRAVGKIWRASLQLKSRRKNLASVGLQSYTAALLWWA